MDARIESHVQQTLAGMPVVQSFAQEDRHLRELLRLTGSAVRAQRRAALVGGMAHLAGGGVTAIGSALVMVFGARLVMRGQMTVGDLLVFLAYLGMLHAELSNLLGSYSSMRGAQASIDRVAELLRQRLGLNAEELPLARVLEGGTWRAGREIAKELREDGGPPIQIVSDGTVF